jgi:hypothetical protein
MRTIWRLLRALALVATAFGAAACSSGGTSATEPATGAGARAAITAAYSTLFNLANPAVEPKIAVIQDGGALRATLTATLKSPLAKKAGGAKVVTATPLATSACTNEALPAPCESVKFDILSTSGKTLLPDNGFAVYIGGKWFVAKVTICGLLSLAAGGTTPAGC